MLTRLQRYQFKLAYRRGLSLYLADTLSQAALPCPVAAKVTGFDGFCKEMVSADKDRNPRLTENSKHKIREETNKDTTLRSLHRVIIHGWPENKAFIQESLRPYWNYRDELSVQNGMIYKGTQVLVPQSMYREMLSKIHANHFGTKSNIRHGSQSSLLARNEEGHLRHL